MDRNGNSFFDRLLILDNPDLTETNKALFNLFYKAKKSIEVRKERNNLEKIPVG